MLTTAQLRQAAARSGARDIGVIEIDVMLTHLLQLFHERGLTEHLAERALAADMPRRLQDQAVALRVATKDPNAV